VVLRFCMGVFEFSHHFRYLKSDQLPDTRIRGRDFSSKSLLKPGDVMGEMGM